MSQNNESVKKMKLRHLIHDDDRRTAYAKRLAKLPMPFTIRDPQVPSFASELIVRKWLPDDKS